MPNPFRNIILQWHRLMNTKVMELDGIKAVTETGKVPRSVQSMLYKNVYELHERELAVKYLKPGDKVLEIGTGIGVVSLVINRICGNGNVLSYEANPDMEPIILENFALNGFEPNLRMKAVTRDGSDIEFYKDDGILSSSSIDRGIKATKCVVESDALERVLNEFDPGWIVMDVEGAEIELLSGADLKHVKGIIAELHPHIVGEEKIDSLVTELSEMGFGVVDQRHKTSVFVRRAAA